jgi:hypothetical protein
MASHDPDNLRSILTPEVAPLGKFIDLQRSRSISPLDYLAAPDASHASP